MREIEIRRWTREEYHRMAESGVLSPDERVELIDGEIFRVMPQGNLHPVAIRLAAEALRAALGKGYDILIQMPLALEPHSEPEPDLAVVRGSPRDFRNSHPTTALLVVEVAETTLDDDRGRKGSLYARAGIPDYWICNLIHRRLEVYRDPATSSTARYGWEYKSVSYYAPGQSLSPLHAPQVQIAVDDLLP